MPGLLVPEEHELLGDPSQAPSSVDRRRARFPVHSVIALVSAVALVVAVVALLRRTSTESVTVVRYDLDAPTLTPPLDDVQSLIARVEPSVAVVEATRPASDRDPHDFLAPSTEEMHGSGIVISREGCVLTNAHVVEDAVQMRVWVIGQEQPLDATVVAVDEAADVAIVRIREPVDLTPAYFAHTDALKVGDSLLAIGFPLNLSGRPTFTRGIVSALDRSVVLPGEEDLLDPRHLRGLIQTDAAISAGNSGGPLVDTHGQVVGIVTIAAKSEHGEIVQGIGFAVPADAVITIVDRWATGCSVPHH